MIQDVVSLSGSTIIDFSLYAHSSQFMCFCMSSLFQSVIGQSCPGSPIFNSLLDSLLAEFGGGSRSNCGSRSPNRKPLGAKNGQL